MALQITGKIELIGKPYTITSKDGQKTYNRREFVIDATRYDPETGDPWENHPKFELSGNNCSIIDGFVVGQKVTVDFTLRGAKYKDDKDETKYFTSINAYRITPVQVNQNVEQKAAEAYAEPAAQKDDLQF